MLKLQCVVIHEGHCRSEQEICETGLRRRLKAVYEWEEQSFSRYAPTYEHQRERVALEAQYLVDTLSKFAHSVLRDLEPT